MPTNQPVNQPASQPTNHLATSPFGFDALRPWSDGRKQASAPRQELCKSSATRRLACPRPSRRRRHVRKQLLASAAVVAPFVSRRANVYSWRARRRCERRVSTCFLWYEPLTQKVDTFIFSDWIDSERKQFRKFISYASV